MATKAPCAPIASRIAAESRRAFAKSGPTRSSGRSQIVSMCSRGTSSEWPGNRGRWSRKASETSSSKTTCAVLVAGDDRAEAAAARRPRHGGAQAGSGDHRKGGRSNAELELAVVADVVAVDLHREGADASVRVAGERLDPALGRFRRSGRSGGGSGVRRPSRGPAPRSSARPAAPHGGAPLPRASRCRERRPRRRAAAGSRSR